MAFFRGKKLAALAFQKAAAHQLFNHTGAGSRGSQARALHILNLCKFLCTGVFHRGKQQIFREVFGWAGGSFTHRRLAAGKGLPLGDGGQRGRFRVVLFRLLLQRGEEGLLHSLPARACYYAPLCGKGSTAAIQLHSRILVNLFFADRA